MQRQALGQQTDCILLKIEVKQDEDWPWRMTASLVGSLS